MLTNANYPMDETIEEESNNSIKVTHSSFDRNLAVIIAVSLALSSTQKSVISQSILLYVEPVIWLKNILPFLDLQFELKICYEWSYKLNRQLGYFFQSHLREIRLKQLLEQVVRGNQTKAKEIIESNPKLLLMRGQVEDYTFGMEEENHRKIEGTAYQVALGADDVEMAKMILSCLETSGLVYVEEVVQQSAQQFLPGWETAEKERAKRDSGAIHRVMNAIEAASEEDCNKTIENERIIQKILVHRALDACRDYDLHALIKINKAISKANSADSFEAAFSSLKNYLIKNGIETDTSNFDLLKAIYQFRNYLEPRGIIKSGKHFNIGLLAEACKIYADKYQDYGDDNIKNMLVWQKVIGYIERFLPACYIQAFSQSIYKFYSKNPLERQIIFRLNVEFYLYPLDDDPHFARLGHHYGIVIKGIVGDITCASIIFEKSARRMARGIMEIYEAKNKDMQLVMQQHIQLFQEVQSYIEMGSNKRLKS